MLFGLGVLQPAFGVPCTSTVFAFSIMQVLGVQGFGWFELLKPRLKVPSGFNAIIWGLGSGSRVEVPKALVFVAG